MNNAKQYLYLPVLFLNTTLQNSTGKLGLLYYTNDVILFIPAHLLSLQSLHADTRECHSAAAEQEIYFLSGISFKEMIFSYYVKYLRKEAAKVAC